MEGKKVIFSCIGMRMCEKEKKNNYNLMVSKSCFILKKISMIEIHLIHINRIFFTIRPDQGREQFIQY